MGPFTAQINAITSNATEYRKASATPSALFEIELWRAAIIVALQQPHTLEVPLHMFIRNPRNREPMAPVRSVIQHRNGISTGVGDISTTK